MVERFVRDEEVDSSSLSAPTIVPRSDMNLNSSGINAVISPFVWVMVSAFCYFTAAGTADAWQGRIYFSLVLALTAISSLMLMQIAPGPMNERGRIRKDACERDKTLTAAYLFADSAVVPFIAGLEYRNAYGYLFGVWNLSLGMAVCYIAFSISIWAMAVNPFYERLARLQSDRDQYAVDAGPYGIVRHPGYLSMALKSTALPLIADSPTALIAALVPCAICVKRAFDEDRMLLSGLKGYAKYSEKVRYKLLPWVV